MFGLGSTELILILAIILIIFGAGKLPEIGGAMGKAIRSFKKSVTEVDIDVTPSEEEGESKKESIEAGPATKDATVETKAETKVEAKIEAEKPKDPVS